MNEGIFIVLAKKKKSKLLLETVECSQSTMLILQYDAVYESTA